MKFDSPTALIEAHLKDIFDSVPSAEAGVKLAHTVTLSILMTANEGDVERTIDAVRELCNVTIDGIDSGEITCERLQ